MLVGKEGWLGRKIGWEGRLVGMVNLSGREGVKCMGWAVKVRKEGRLVEKEGRKEGWLGRKVGLEERFGSRKVGGNEGFGQCDFGQ